MTAVFTLATFILAGPAVINAQQVTEQSAEVSRMVDYTPFVMAMEKAGLTYSKTSSKPNSSSWVIPWKADEERININAVSSGTVISLAVIVGPKPAKLSEDLKIKLIDLNNRYYFVKFAFDSGNLYMRIDTLVNAVNDIILMDYVTRLTRAYQAETTELMAAAGKTSEKEE